MAKSSLNLLAAASTLAFGASVQALAAVSPLSGTNLWTSPSGTESAETPYSVPAGSSMSANNLFVGKYNDSAAGTLAITGTGSLTLQSGGFIQVGSSAGATSSGGQGTLTVSNGGTISNSGSDFYIRLGAQGGSGGAGGSGLFILSNSMVRLERISAGSYSSDSTGGTGTVTVDGGGVLNLNYLDIATSSGSGAVRVNAGGTMSVAGAINLGSGYPNNGAALLSVNGGTLNANGTISISQANQGLLNISNAGTAVALDELLVVGNGNGIMITSGGTLTCRSTLKIGGLSNNMGDTTTATISGGTLNTSATSEIGAFGTTAKLMIEDKGVYNNSGSIEFGATVFGIGTGSMEIMRGGVFNTLTGSSVKLSPTPYTDFPYSKPITIDAGGTWNVGYNGATSISISLPSSVGITNNGLINFCQSDSLTLGAQISGSGAIAQIGTGATTLSGENTYTGGTTVSAGTLAFSSISNLGTGPLSISGCTAQYTGGSPISLPQINVSGNTTSYFLTTQDATVTREIDVSPGSTLIVGDTSNPRTLTIAQGASMLGSVVVHGNLVNRGTITPNDPKIVNVINFVNQGGTVNIAIAGSGAPGTVNGYDQIKYSGTAAINGGVLKITLLNGYVPGAGSKFAFLQGGEAPTGGFSTISLPALPSGLYGQIVVGANDMEYVVLPGNVTNSGPHQTSVPAPAAALSPVGLVAVDALVIDEGRATTAFLRTRAQADASPIRDGANWSTFAAIHGSSMTWGGASDGGNFDQTYYGGKAGLSDQVTDGVSLGFAFGYDKGDATLHDSLGRINQDRASLTTYASIALGSSGYLYAGLTGGYSDYTSERDTIFGAKNGKTTGIDLGGSVGIGNTFGLGGNWFVSPHASITYTRNDTAKFTETGSINDSMEIARRSGESLRARIGNDFGYSFGSLRLSLGAAYEHECLDSTSKINAAYANGMGAFEVTGKTLSQDIIVATLNATWAITERQSFSVGYAYDYGLQGSSANSINAAYTLRF